MNIPPEFWKTLTDRQWLEVCETSVLQRKLCQRLWRMTGRTDKPPDKLFVMVNAEDVMRRFPPSGKYQ